METRRIYIYINLLFTKKLVAHKKTKQNVGLDYLLQIVKQFNLIDSANFFVATNTCTD